MFQSVESSSNEEEEEFVLFNPLIAIVISSGIILSLSFVSILICLVRSKSQNSSDSGSDLDERKSSSTKNYKSSSSPTQSYESNGGGGYVTTDDGLLLKTLNDGRDRHGNVTHHHTLAAYSTIGDALKVVTESELDHELLKESNTPGSGGYHTLSSSRVYCEEGGGGTTRYTSVGPVIDYRPHYEYSLGGIVGDSSTLDSRQGSVQFHHLHQSQNLTPQHVVNSSTVSVSSESAFDVSPQTLFGQVLYEVCTIYY